ncbi:hypothetical protein HYE67_007665 [Fusarium culmorum]|uniref:Uncharacterized protein n=1 Tax=Fusarium culmorum TaxID=5516 RepID=A0A2T4H1Z9_FUSCU|nr:hypothetical protein FCULG_00008766 [Fusarium culmorum]QPC65434.1 hypothetical protein HYE67_007665 [Fusarium culmorum]
MSREVESVTNYLLQNRIRGIGVVEPQWMFLFAVRKLAQAHNRTKNFRRTIPGTNLSLKCSVVVVHSIIVLPDPQGPVSALDAMQATRHSQGTCEKNEGVDMLTGRGYPAMKP